MGQGPGCSGGPVPGADGELGPVDSVRMRQLLLLWPVDLTVQELASLGESLAGHEPTLGQG